MSTSQEGCSKCSYTGFIRLNGDDTRVQQCICSYAKTLKAYLGPEIASAPTITKSPFYEVGPKGEAPRVDATRENLFIKSYWSDLLPHLKWALGCKGPLFRYRVVTDEKIKTVYLGNESYRTRAKDVRDDVETYNSIGDLVGPDQDLVIVRIGFLGYKNIAMPGILKEALMLRESAMKPTWIVELPSNPFVPGHFSYSEDIGTYVSRLYRTVEVQGTGDPVDDMEEEDGTVGLNRPDYVPSRPAATPKQAEPLPPFVTSNPLLLELLEDKPKPSGKYSAWKPKSKRKGGGPV